MAGKFIADLIEVAGVYLFRSEPLVNKEYDMVRVTLYMPRWLWRRNCKYLNVDEVGKPLEE